MQRRTGVNKRQVVQLKKALEAGNPVSAIAGHFNIEVAVVFRFAKNWDIKLKETPESIALAEQDQLIEFEVAKRLAEREKLGAKPVRAEFKPIKGNK